MNSLFDKEIGSNLEDNSPWRKIKMINNDYKKAKGWLTFYVLSEN